MVRDKNLEKRLSFLGKIGFERASTDEKEPFDGMEWAGGSSESQRSRDVKTSRRKDSVILQWAMFQSWTSLHEFGQVSWSHISQLLDLNKEDQKWSLFTTGNSTKFWDSSSSS